MSFLGIFDYEFDRVDLICVGFSTAFGIWYLTKKVQYCKTVCCIFSVALLFSKLLRLNTVKSLL